MIPTAVFDVTTFCVITGASRGIGRSISVELSERVGPGSVLVLVARTERDLHETRSLIRSDSCAVHCVVGDVSRTSQDLLKEILQHASAPSKFEHAILVNNAGSLGDISKKLSLNDDVSALDSFWSLNLSSYVALTSGFLAKFREYSSIRKTVVQTSSRISERPTPGLSLYCSAKAARLMLFKVLAIEEPDVRVLSFGPGPVQTQMWESLQQIGHEGMRHFFNEMSANGRVRSAEVPVKFLMKILEDDEFESGSHVLMPDD